MFSKKKGKTEQMDVIPDWNGIADQYIKCEKCDFEFILPMVAMIAPGKRKDKNEMIKLWDETLSRKFKKNIHIEIFAFPKTKICTKCQTVYETKYEDTVIKLDYKYWEKIPEDQFSVGMLNIVKSSTIKKKFEDIKKCNCGGKLIEFKKCPCCSSGYTLSNIEYYEIPIIIGL